MDVDYPGVPHTLDPWRASQDRYGHQPGHPSSHPSSSTITGDVPAKLRGLKAIADGRGQSLAQMALAWVLRDPLVASTLIGASSVAQLDENLGALANLDFSGAELAAIDEYATDANINVWQASSEL